MSSPRILAPAFSAICITLTAGPARGQASGATTPIAVTTSFGENAQTSPNAIVIALSRPLTPQEGELALVVAGLDVTAVSERTPSRISYRPTAVEIPAGETEIVLYRRTGREWTELRRFVTRLRQGVGGGGGVASADKSATLGNTGQLAQGQSTGLPTQERRTFQDFVLNAGVRSNRDGSGWGFTTQSNFVGVSRRQQALRFATHGNRAPMLDLSDYVLSGRLSDLRASVGHVNFGESRHLASGISARGAALSMDHGATSIRVGALSGTAEVGWSDISGLERSTNRMFGASIGQEVVAARPGALRLDATVLQGSKLPITSFTQSAVVDAQRSLGSSVQLTAALPNQRLRAVAGYARSRFENPNLDPQLHGDSSTRRPQPATRGARFLDLSAAVLQNVAAPGGAANLTIGVRDERVDPLYGSVGAAAVAADRQNDAVDATLSWGAITGQFTTSAGRDNLGRVASILTTDNRTSGASVAIPLASFAGPAIRRVWLPILTGTFNRTHQFAAGVPTNGQFRPTDLPDQVSASGDVALAWQVDRYRLSIRGNRSAQDNREALREQADFEAGVRALSLGVNLGSRGDVSVDLGDEYQLAKEHDERTSTRRLTLNSSLTPRPGTGVVAALSVLRTRRPVGAATVNGEGRFELSQGIGLRSGSVGEQRGQIFLRYARTVSLVPDPAFGVLAPFVRAMRQQWTLASGLNLRLF